MPKSRKQSEQLKLAKVGLAILRTTNPELADLLVQALDGPDKEKYLGNLVYPAAVSRGTKPGKVVGVRRCPMAGCTGVRLVVKWAGGSKTMPCTKGMRENRPGVWRIA